MQLEVGQRFDRYQIVRQLGNGISGESYEAQDTLLQRTVTLKLIHPWSTLPDAIRRQFFREMQNMSLLNHAALASILDYSDVDRQLYLAHKYAPFGSLLGAQGRAWFSPPLPLEEALRYTIQLAQPLQYLHYNGFYHGSLTFTNILLQHDPAQPDGSSSTQFLLADASLAQFVRRYGHPIIALLPITAAPEQFSKRTTAASDQYALASLLYYWLTARPPFLGTPEEIRQQKLHATALALSKHNPQVTPEFAGVVQRALSTAIDDRFPSVQAFAEALQEAYQPLVFADTDPALTSLHPSEPAKSNGHNSHLDQSLLTLSEPLPVQSAAMSEVAEPAPKAPVEVAPLSPPEEPPRQSLPESTPPPERVAPQQEPPASTDTEIAVKEPDAAPSPSSPHFMITSPYVETPYEVMIDREEMTIGRAGSSDIFLDYDPFTSRHQALLQKRNEQYVISDRRSAYGTTVNGQKLMNDQIWPLQEGDQISIGQYKLVFCL